MSALIQVMRGDGPTVDVVTAAGAAEAAVAAFTAKRRLADPDSDAVIRIELGDGLELDDAVAHLVFDASDTDELEAPLLLVYDIEAEVAGVPTTIAIGYLRVLADVTRSASSGS